MPMRVEGASEHNLRNVTAEFGDGLTVVTGVSGSGKTSLVFDTVYHEARRRLQDIFALGATGVRLSPAAVGAIYGLRPAIAVRQNVLNRNPNSTLASATGLQLLLRLLYSRFGRRLCPACGHPCSLLDEDEVVTAIVSLARECATELLVPLVRGVVGSHATLLRLLGPLCGEKGLLVDAEPYVGGALAAKSEHDITVVLGELEAGAGPASVRQMVRRAGAMGGSVIAVRGGETVHLLSLGPVCALCGTWLQDLRSAHFGSACPHCGGEGCARCRETGLHPQAASVVVGDLGLPGMLGLAVCEASDLLGRCELPAGAARLRREMLRRLHALQQVGLGYVQLDRASPSLSRGEAQRVRLALSLVNCLEDVLHVLDEPTIGQHAADVQQLMPQLRQLPGPVVLVEHDRQAAAEADWAIDLGPGPGRHGGRVTFSGSAPQLWRSDTATGRFFSLRSRPVSRAHRAPPTEFLRFQGAHLHNLKHIDVAFALGGVSVVTGVSGSGKSTLVEHVLVASLKAGRPVGCAGLSGPWLRPLLVDQSPIGRNPRSNVATYTRLADVVRDLFAGQTGLSPSHFSFNRPEGACPACKGMGAVEVAMKYLPSTWVRCEACEGLRFRDSVLEAEIRLQGKPYCIADFFRLEVGQALRILSSEQVLRGPSTRVARRILRALIEVGLGYLPLDQPTPTLSGGEAQRVRLARQLGHSHLPERILVLDEPTTGCHPQDVSSLIRVFDRLSRQGATLVVVEHHLDVIRAADWVVDLGPGSGAGGGEVLFCGPAGSLAGVSGSPTAAALLSEEQVRPHRRGPRPARRGGTCISVRGARMHNLKDLDVDIPKGRFTVVTGVSGSGKSTLVSGILENEARRRFLETLSMYERQSTCEGVEPDVDSVSGMGVTIPVGTERGLRYDWRASVGTATELSRHLAILLSVFGRRRCLQCAELMERLPPVRSGEDGIGRESWGCPSCGARAPVAQPRHFSPQTYAAACLDCHGTGSVTKPRPEKLIIHPELPLCAGAMYSPGFFPKGYLCKPFNGGYDMTQALALRHGFDPAETPWKEMSHQAQQVFLFGDSEPLDVTFVTRQRTSNQRVAYPGFYGWIRDWDVGGMYTDQVRCPACGGQRLRAEYLAVSLLGCNMHQLCEMPVSQLCQLLDSQELDPVKDTGSGLRGLARSTLDTARLRLRFLEQVGVGYLHLNRRCASLSAGEAQRIRLTRLLASDLTSLTVLLDEPTRGMHPKEVGALTQTLESLRDQGHTVIVVEHDPILIRQADHVIDLGPGAGQSGGNVVAQGSLAQVAAASSTTGRWISVDAQERVHRETLPPQGWLEIRGARANNLRGETIRIPLGVLVGVCGASGSGKSTLVVDTLALALAPKKMSTSVAYEPIAPGEHDAIVGAPKRTIVVDQSLAGLSCPADYLSVAARLRAVYAESGEARALGLGDDDFRRGCATCGGEGFFRTGLGFLPDVFAECDTCGATGFRPEAWEVRLRGVALPELYGWDLDAVRQLWSDDPRVRGPLQAACDVGLGYLVLRQPRHALSGGEAQRLKMSRELGRPVRSPTLYILDEPTVGHHLSEVSQLVGVLHRLVEAGHSVVVVEHHPDLLAACDWLVELGPGGGPDGGYLIAEGPPAVVAGQRTPTAPYLQSALGVVP